MVNGSFQGARIKVYNSGIHLIDKHSSCFKDIKIQVFLVQDRPLMTVISVALGPIGAGKLFATGSGDCRARIWSYEKQ